MDRGRLRVLPGGKSENLFAEYRFIDGQITDTRLMGVLGMHLHWELPYPAAEPHLHQYYYYDVEELGLETYRTYEGDDPVAVELACKNLFGGLGAKMKPLSEREGRYLASEFISETRRRKLPLPDRRWTWSLSPKCRCCCLPNRRNWSQNLHGNPQRVSADPLLPDAGL